MPFNQTGFVVQWIKNKLVLLWIFRLQHALSAVAVYYGNGPMPYFLARDDKGPIVN